MVDRLEFERRLMIAAVVLTCLAAVIWLTAISTDEWCKVTFYDWTYVSSTNVYMKSLNMGLWRVCARLYFNATNTTDAIGRGTCNSKFFVWTTVQRNYGYDMCWNKLNKQPMSCDAQLASEGNCSDGKYLGNVWGMSGSPCRITISTCSGNNLCHRG